MKRILLLIIAIGCLVPGLYAQINLGDMMGEAQDFFGEAQDEAENEAATEAFEKQFGPLLKSFSEYTNKSKTGKCLHIMGEYLYALAKLDLEAHAESDPCKKRELLAMEGMLLLAGTNINYCPIDFYEDQTTYGQEIYNYFFAGFQEELADDVAHSKRVFEEQVLERLKKFRETAATGISEDKTFNYEITGDNDWARFMAQLEINQETELALRPHFRLYVKFLFANYVLKGSVNDGMNDHTRFESILSKDAMDEFFDPSKSANTQTSKLGLVDFTSYLFQPDFLVAKTLDIANDNETIDCNK